MKGNELIEKILNKEIKSGTLIKMKSHYPGLEWEKTICFNGNWFSEEKYYPGVPSYDDIIVHLCSDCMTFEIIEEDEKIEPLDYEYINTYGNVSQCKKSEERIIDKINEIIDKVNKGE